MTAGAVIVAAGRGLRAGGDIPKQWQEIAGRPVLLHTMDLFRGHLRIDKIVVVLAEDDLQRAEDLQLSDHAEIALGGETRSASVRAGLEALDCDHVLIHDAARCTMPPHLIDAVLDALAASPGAAPALGVTDALWTGDNARVTGLQDRTRLYRAQTPQGFDRVAILDAHSRHGTGSADDVEVALKAGLEVAIVPGDERNLKITTPDDFARAARELTGAKPEGPKMDIRLGNGYDVHRFGPGDHVWLCGVQIPHTRSLQGHSDADVGMHAVTDAIYGALGKGDIGQHFPPSDPQWKGAESHIFLKHAVALAADEGFSISNVDCTLVCELPKIGPHQDAMKAVMGAYMGLDSDRISVKATTSEKLGFTGREEGIAAIATVTLIKP